MRTEKLATAPAFVVFDLPEAPSSTGPVRLAPKVLQSSAADLARSVTYAHALMALQVGGASAGISAKGDERAGALAAFVEEIRPWVESGRFLPVAGRGVAEEDLAGVLRGPGTAERAAAIAAGALGAASVAAGSDLAGRTIALDGLGEAALRFAELAVARGARVVSVGDGDVTVADPGGIDVAVLRGGGALTSVAAATDVPARGAGADVLAVSTGVGSYDHVSATTVEAGILVPLVPLPVTARGLAVLGQRGTTVLPDFVTAAGEALVAAGGVAAGEVEARIAAVAAELKGHPEGWFLAACYRAEEFLRTWCDELPFGRPLAA